MAKRVEEHSSDEEPIPVEKPPEDKFSRYEAEQQLIKQLEWGKKLEPLGRTLDWVTDQAKWASRRAAGVAQDLSASAPEMAGHAMVQFRKTAASQLKRLATALEVPENDGVESSNATISAGKVHHGHSRHEKK